jgi:hypothetical protein
MLLVSRSSPRFQPRHLLVLGLAAALLAACGSDEEPAAPSELDGAAVAVGNGTASAFVVQGPSGPTAIGVKLTPGALDGLPTSDDMWSLPLPAGVSVPAYDHVMLNWNAQGHPPDPYMVPHFDFHFYTISASAQAAIQAGPDTVTVPPQYVPKDYESGVMAVPDMGVHWVDTLSAEFHGKPFTGTFIYGFSKGSMVFLEPMVTQAYLRSQPNISTAVKQPEAWQVHGHYPTVWSIRTDPDTRDIRVTLDSLVAR